MKISNFLDANEFLKQFYVNARLSYTLDVMQELMLHLGSPQEKYRIIHVAGTSGKTSTAYYAAALLSSAGYKTGLTVSPHVDEINERVQINLQPVEQQEFCEALTEFQDLIEQSTIKPSWFEAMMAFAFWYFAREKVEYAVIEVGLGGLLDGTNVIKRADKVCVITDIGYDHTQILGKTLPEIAAQKAGIIHPDNHVLMHKQPQSVIAVIEKVAEQRSASLSILQTDTYSYNGLPLFQKRNFALAEASVEYLVNDSGHPPVNKHQRQIARQTLVPGRMEIIAYKGKTIILDGAHNAQKLGALKQALAAKYPDQQIAALVGFAEGDENRLEAALEVLEGLASYMIVTSFVTAKDYLKHSVDPKQVQDLAKSSVDVEPSADLAFQKVMSRPEGIILITGSFYLLNHIRPLMLKA